MASSLSTSNSKKSFSRYFYGVVLALLGTYYVSLIAFYFNPQIFYWRAWEFFDEIVYKQEAAPPAWEGYEKGDRSRSYWFEFQKSWKTTVSCDEHGFRSVPFKVNKYPILIVGDSHTWGSGLSDDETIAWQISEKLNTPVFNGGRYPFYLERLIKGEKVKDAKLIIQFLVEGHFDENLFKDSFKPKKYKALKRGSSFFFGVPLQRYFLPYKFLRHLSYIAFYDNLKVLLNTHDHDENMVPLWPMVFPSIKHLDIIVMNIVRRSEELASLGYKYVFIPVPDKCRLVCKHIIGDPGESLSELVNKLSERGVHAIDLMPTFLNERDKTLLYMRTDSHWSALATQLASEEVAKYIRANGLIE